MTMSVSTKDLSVAAPSSTSVRRLRSHASVLGLACAASVGCSGPTGDPTSNDARPSPAAVLDPLAAGASIVCGVRQIDGRMPTIEMYMVYTMNHKLRRYPELASSIGVDLVSDCESARRYVRGYLEYARGNPGFDADEPTPPSPPDRPLPDPEEVAASEPEPEEIEKVFDGEFVANNAVVQIRMRIPTTMHRDWGVPLTGVTQVCTGTFINKNWILTAAHCLTWGAIYPCLKDGRPPLACTPQWDNYNAPYTISGTKGADGNAWSLTAGVVRGYVMMKWDGTNIETNPEYCPDEECYDFLPGAKHDLGLLYVPSHFYDDDLPPRVEEGGALRLSIDPDPDVAVWDMQFYGTGAPSLRLQRGTMLLGQYSDHLIRGIMPPGTAPNPFTCGGDSGGPLVRSNLSLQTNEGLKTGQEAIVGVLSGGTGACAAPTTPAERAAISDYWVRIDETENAAFIRNTMRDSNWKPYSTIQCKPRALTSAPNDPVVAECWGEPCMVSCQDPGDVCTFSGRYIETRQGTQCGACDYAGCGCIVGQCAPQAP
jgi:hypothetical protein